MKATSLLFKRYILALMSLAVTVAAVASPRISLLTAGPGNQMYQLEGHSALRIITDDGEDMAVNWGMFDFSTPNFAYRFVKGQTDYSIGAAPMTWFLAEYARSGRYVKEQPLNLSPAEAEEVVRLVNINLQPENRVYRYNYVRDNCATRPLAIIEKALAVDGAHLAIDMPEESVTIRDEMRRYHANFPTYQLFIDFALGSGIDNVTTPRERAFAPIYLSNLAAHSAIVTADGTSRPLTSGTETLLYSEIGTPSESGIPWIVLFLALITVSAIEVSIRDIRRRRISRWYDATFFGIIGLVGLIAAFLVFVSEHEATSPNINLLWADPLCLIIPLIIWFKKCKYIVFYFQIINFALLLVWLVGQPFFHQSTNLLFIPLVCCEMLRCATYIHLNRKCLDHTKA